jgi:hypothetical protein
MLNSRDGLARRRYREAGPALMRTAIAKSIKAPAPAIFRSRFAIEGDTDKGTQSADRRSFHR